MPVNSSPFITASERARQNREQRTTTPAIAREQAEIYGAQEGTTSTILFPCDPSNEEVAERPSSKRRLQNVLSVAQRAMFLKFMLGIVEKEGNHHIASKAVAHFSQYFRGRSNANITKASRIWKQRQSYMKENGSVSLRGDGITITTRCHVCRKRVNMKATCGRNRKRLPWVDAFHVDLISEFHRLRQLGVKFNLNNLSALRAHILTNNMTNEYNMNMIDPLSSGLQHFCITPRFTQSFAYRFAIVSRALTGKHKSSPKNAAELENHVAHHPGILCRGFRMEYRCEGDVKNADETHFVIDEDNGRILGFTGDKEVKYADSVSAGEGKTMLVKLIGGRDAIIQSPFLIFNNYMRYYPIRDVLDDKPGISYRSGPKGWVNTIVAPQWLSERKVFNALHNQRTRILYHENCSGHNLTSEFSAAAAATRTEICCFPPSITYFVQPCDSFVIQKIKVEWCGH